MKVLIVLARQTRMGSYHLPLGIGYVSASLKQAGHDVEVLNPNHSCEDTEPLIRAALNGFQPDVIATGGLAFHFNEIQYVTQLARQYVPQAKTIIGGPLVSTQPEPIFKAMPAADFGVIGEGEHTAVELVSALETGAAIDDVRGLVYRDGSSGELKRTPPRPMERDLDVFPWCDYEGLGLDVYSRIHRPGECAPALVADASNRVMPLLTSRGCPFSCTFCCHEEVGHHYRKRSLDDVFSEIAYSIKRFGINTLFILDDLFCPQRSRLVEFCERVKPLKLRWGCSMVAGQITPEIPAMMKDAGCVYISIGLESMSSAVLKSMKKKDSKTTIETALARIYDAGIAVWSNLIFGDPAETPQTAMESLEWMWHHSHYNIRTAMVGYHPGSLIYTQARQRGLIADPVAYLAANKPEINATAMSDDEYHSMESVIGTGQWLFGYAGKLVDLRIDRGHVLTQTACPVCGATGTCHTFRLQRFAIPAVNCPRCNRPHRVPVVVRTKATPEVLYLIESLEILERSGARTDAVEALCDQILQLYSHDNRVWRCKLRIADTQGQRDKSIGFLETMLMNDPYNPVLFEETGTRLSQVGNSVAAEKFLLKAQHLKQVGIDRSFYVDLQQCS